VRKRTVRKRTDDYVEKLANSIEEKLDMTSDEIAQMKTSEFRNLLKHGYFVRKKYEDAQSEPTQKQMDVLSLHYKGKIPTTIKAFYNANRRFYYRSYETKRIRAPKYIRRNSAGRFIDAKTGKFVKVKK